MHHFRFCNHSNCMAAIQFSEICASSREAGSFSSKRHLNVEWPLSSIWLLYIIMWTFNMSAIYFNIILHSVALHNTLLENDHAFYKSSWIWWHLKNSNVSTHVLLFSHFTLYDWTEACSCLASTYYGNFIVIHIDMWVELRDQCPSKLFVQIYRIVDDTSSLIFLNV